MINNSKQGWISDKIGNFFGGIVNKSTEGLIEHAKQAFKESMDYLFDQKLKPLINQIEATAERAMDHAVEDINKVVDNFEQKMVEMVEKAAKIAKDFVDHTVDEIKTRIIDNIFDKLNELEEKIFSDITTILNKVDEILQSISCYAHSVIDRIEEDIKKVLPSFYNPFEYCRVKLNIIFPGIRWKLINSMTHEELYEYRKCLLTKDLNEKSLIRTIQAAYREIELLAGNMRCLSVALGSIQNEKFYIQEMGEVYYILSIYNTKVSGKHEFNQDKLNFLS